MSLSTGTLNLKFMQRAAARNAATAAASPSTSTPAKPATPAPGTPSTPSAGPSRLAETPLAGSPDTKPDVSLATEEEGKWFIPKRATSAKGKERAHDQWTFDSSYMAFIDSASHVTTTSKTRATAERQQTGSRAGGGRMTFGGFGEEVTEEEEGDGGGEKRKGDAGSDDSEGDIKPEPTRRESKKEFTAPPRTFQRPKGFTPPPSSPAHSGPPRRDETSRGTPRQNGKQCEKQPFVPKPSAAQKLRETIAASRKASSPMSSAPSTPAPSALPDLALQETSAGKKRKQRPSVSDASGTQTPDLAMSTSSSLNGSSLDAREAELKAQKKREKNARKKAKRAEKVKAGENE